MRAQRIGLVETLEQLKFIYDTLEEFVLCGYTYFPVNDISQILKQKS
jgi:protein tyrosine phosphatase